MSRTLVKHLSLGPGWFRIWIVATVLWSIGFIAEMVLRPNVGEFPRSYLSYVPNCPSTVNLPPTEIVFPYTPAIETCFERLGITAVARRENRRAFDECQATARTRAEAAEQAHQRQLEILQAAREQERVAALRARQRLSGTCLVTRTAPTNGLARPYVWREVLEAERPNATTVRAAKAVMRSAQANWIASLVGRVAVGLAAVPLALYFGLAALIALTRWIRQGFSVDQQRR